jgi:hypothetical protein
MLAAQKIVYKDKRGAHHLVESKALYKESGVELG